MKLNLVSPLVSCFVMAVGLFPPAGAFATEGGALPEPPQMCMAQEGCTPQMLSILGSFNRAKQAPSLKAIPKVFSGECYYLGFGTDPTVKQYGVTLLDLAGEQPQFSSLWTFFYHSDPFRRLTPETARSLLLKSGSTETRLAFGKDFAYVEFLETGSAIRYWLRQDPRTLQMDLVSEWSFSQEGKVERIFCRMKPTQRE
jgi:hypothetical protein